MNKIATVLALLTFAIAGGFALYGHSTYSTAKVEFDRREAQCESPNSDALCRLARVSDPGYLAMLQAEETRNTGSLVAITGPVAIWLFVIFWRGVASPGIRKGAEAGRDVVEEVSKRSALATREAVGTVAKLADTAQGRTRECPFCAEMIKPHAKICKHCGNNVATE